MHQMCRAGVPMPAVTVRFRNLCVKGRVVAAAPTPPASGTSKVQTATQVSRLEQGRGCSCLTGQIIRCLSTAV